MSPETNRAALRAALARLRYERPGWDPALVTDRMAVSLSLARDRLALPLARAARAFIRGRSWFTFGYARIEDHARERFDRSGRWVRDLSRLADVVERLPQLGVALTGEDGGQPLGRVVALLIGRAATPETVTSWIELGRSKTVREFRELINLGGDGTRGPSSNVLECPNSLNTNPMVRTPLAEASDCSDGDALAESCTIRFTLPRAVIAALDEARDLFSAISGGHGGFAEFVEMLLAEDIAGGGELVQAEIVSAGRVDEATRERRFAKTSEEWAFLKRLSDARAVLSETEQTLSEIESLCVSTALASPDADGWIRSLIALEDEIEAQLGDLLSMMSEARVWRSLMFAGLGHYATERLGIARRTVEDRMRLARTLREFPAVSEAYENGEIGAQAAAIVGRVLKRAQTEFSKVPIDEALEDTWIDHAMTTTVRRLRDELRLQGRTSIEQRMSPREQPFVNGNDSASSGAPGRESSEPPCFGKLDQGPLGFRPRSRGFEPPDDATWLRSLVRYPGDAIDRVTRYGRAAADTSSWDIRVFPMRLPFDLADSLLTAVKSKARLLGQVVPSCASATLDGRVTNVYPSAQTFSTRAIPSSVEIANRLIEAGRTVPDWVGLLALIEDFVRTWDDPRQSPKRKADEIYNRDGWRCVAPGCSSRQNLEDHHIVYRSHGGSDEPHNRVCLCRFHHHQGEHGGLMRCRGEAPLGIRWTLGDLGVGGVFENDRRV